MEHVDAPLAQGLHDVCNSNPCVCPVLVLRLLATQDAWVRPADGAPPVTWLRLIPGENGAKLLGCWICREHGGKLRGRQALGRYELELSQSVHLDTTRRHVQAKQGDHAKAVDAWRSTLRLPLALPQTPAVAAQPQPLLDSLQVDRARFPVSVLDRNLFVMAYTSHMSRLSLHQFTTMTTAAIGCGAQLEGKGLHGTFYKECADIAGMLIYERLLREIMQCRALCICADEAKGVLVIRLRYFTSDYELKTCFWSAQKIHQQDANSLCRAVLHSLTSSPYPELPQTLSEDHLAKVLVGFVADGHTVNGVGTCRQPRDSPKPGSNLASLLQDFKRKYNQEGLTTAWCAPHRVDLSAEALKKVPICEKLMDGVRRLAGHIRDSHKAKGELKALHQLFTASPEGGARTASYAPQRFVSFAPACKTLLDNIPELICYLYSLEKTATHASLLPSCHP